MSNEPIMNRPAIQSITANLIVDRIEDCLPFWVERLGFETTVTVPHGEALGFVILKHGATELMLQSRASMQKDVKEIGDEAYKTVVYITVASLDPIRKALEGYPTIIPERTTFYGAREIFVRDPAGNPVAFSEHAG